MRRAWRLLLWRLAPKWFLHPGPSHKELDQFAGPYVKLCSDGACALEDEHSGNCVPSGFARGHLMPEANLAPELSHVKRDDEGKIIDARIDGVSLVKDKKR